MKASALDVTQANDEEYTALGTFLDQMRVERLPDDPPIPLAERIRWWQNLPPFLVIRKWVVWHLERPEIIAHAELQFHTLEHNRHVADFYVSILPEYRRQGLARGLLVPVVASAQTENRTLLITSTSSTVPSGEAFVRRLGCKMGLALHTNQLDVSQADMDLVRRWQERAAERAAGFELLVWEGRVPDTHLETFAQLIGAMNLAPRGELHLEDFHVTPEQVRQNEQAEQAGGNQRWRIVAREKSAGRLAGYTEVIWHPNRPYLLQQGDTVVLGEYQNRGLGRWLKAAMLDKVRRERPQVRHIRTNNAYQNEPMLKINMELGFKPYRSEFIWQIETAQVRAYLESADRRRNLSCLHDLGGHPSGEPTRPVDLRGS